MNTINEIQRRRYDLILKNIDQNFEENTRLKLLLENENCKIFLQKLKNNDVICKLSQVNVKIFRNILELYSLYDNNLPSFESLQNYRNHKFYLIEVYLTKLLLKKLHNLKWSLLVSISHKHGNTSKVIPGISKTCLLDIIPIDETVMNSIVQTDLILPLADQITIINLNKTRVDISYHLSTKLYTKTELGRPEILMNITKLYNSTLEFKYYLLPVLDYEMRLGIGVKSFMRTFIKNCYHSLDLEIFNELDSENKTEFKFTVSSGQQQKYSISVNKQNVIISATYKDLYLLKKYFYEVFHNHKQWDSNTISNHINVSITGK